VGRESEGGNFEAGLPLIDRKGRGKYMWQKTKKKRIALKKEEKITFWMAPSIFPGGGGLEREKDMFITKGRAEKRASDQPKLEAGGSRTSLRRLRKRGGEKEALTSRRRVTGGEGREIGYRKKVAERRGETSLEKGAGGNSHLEGGQG